MNELENTARILKEQPPLVTSRWCLFGIHTWEKWGKAYTPVKNNSRHVQTRHCACCNQVQVKEVELPYWLK